LNLTLKLENKDEKNQTEIVTNKKKRVTKKFNSTLLGSVDENNLTALGITSQVITKPQECKQSMNKLSSHFTFGNQGSTVSDALMNKTSNNRLDQSLRLSYSEMSDILKSFKPSFDNSIKQQEKLLEDSFFIEWLNIIKYKFF
jgi:delta 1-pyrroline-5-carboxylate dehydrogenase